MLSKVDLDIVAEVALELVDLFDNVGHKDVAELLNYARILAKAYQRDADLKLSAQAATRVRKRRRELEALVQRFSGPLIEASVLHTPSRHRPPFKLVGTNVQSGTEVGSISIPSLT